MYHFFFLSRIYIISSTNIIAESGRKHALRKTSYALRKTSYLPNHTSIYYQVCLKLQQYLRRKLASTAICLVLLAYQFDEFFNPKNASETNDSSNTPPTWQTYEFSRHICSATMPTTHIPTDASV